MPKIKQFRKKISYVIIPVMGVLLVFYLTLTEHNHAVEPVSNSTEVVPEPETFILGKHNAIRQVFRDPESFDGIRDNSVHLYGARHEYVAFQILCYSRTQSLEKMRFHRDHLVHAESGSRISSEHIRTNFVGYIKTSQPYYGVSRVGYWPDPLLESDTLSVPGNMVQPVWVTIYIPPDAKPGEYTTRIILETDNLPAETFRINLTVWSFNIPEEIHLRTAFLLYPKYLIEFHNLDKRSPKYEKMLMTYYRNMLEHRIMPSENLQAFPSAIPNIDRLKRGQPADFSKYDELLRKFYDMGQRGFNIGRLTRDKSEMPRLFGAWADHLEKTGYLDYFYAYLFDETYEDVQTTYELLHRGHPKLKTLLTHPPSEDLPDVDIWCPRITTFYMEQESIQSFMKSGKEMWMYTAGNAETECPAHHLDVPMIESRIIPWICWKEDIDGYLFWVINYWTKDPWKDPMVYPRQNGNGIFYYPGKEGPVPSIRLEAFRDGMEDYEYFYLLKDQLRKIGEMKESVIPDHLRDFAEQLCAVHPSIVSSAVAYTRDAWQLYSYRIVMGEIIDYFEMMLNQRQSEPSPILKAAVNGRFRVGGSMSNSETVVLNFSQGKDFNRFSGGERIRKMPDPENEGAVMLETGLTKARPRLSCEFASPQDWSGYDFLKFRIINKSTDQAKVSFLIADKNGNRWSMEIILKDNDSRWVTVELPAPFIDTRRIDKLFLFVWEPKIAKTDFALGDFFLYRDSDQEMIDMINELHIF